MKYLYRLGAAKVSASGAGPRYSVDFEDWTMISDCFERNIHGSKQPSLKFFVHESLKPSESLSNVQKP